ncbi:MAG: peptidase M16 [Nitrospinae bacterium]|nr:peptidase M16 [Nitrospinota bacterium]
MGFELDKSYHGFKLIKKEEIAELNSLGLFFEHEGTGAEVLVLENDDDNKVFSATFRTPPTNDAGVAHILEHSVLCGSKNFPVKEPFVELMKGSLQTFLNAMTFPDKTMYPVASRNRKDFFNLMNVYMDAVFYPVISEDTFKQEGWHYELSNPDDKIVYKGVVFNEMKGVFSDPESCVDRQLAHSLFPSTTYGYESGGDPNRIPDLTYEDFREFHKKHYHPSNSRIFLYGDGDTNEYLSFLHEKYLKDFNRIEVDTSIKHQRSFRKPKRKIFNYPVSSDESLDKKTYVVIGYKLDRAVNYEHCLGFSILSHLLLGTSASPLRKALIDSQLGSEIFGGGFDDNRADTLFAVGLKGTEAEHEDKILGIIDSTLTDLVENGIEEDMVRSAVNSVDFRLREANFGGFAKGIVYNIQTLGSWLYDQDPFSHLKFEKIMRKIKRKSSQGYFEKLIKRYLIENSHKSILVATPQAGLGKKQEARERKKLREIKKSLSQKEINSLIEETGRLQENQLKPDNPEALATLPSLEIKDVPDSIENYPLEVRGSGKRTVLFHNLFTNNIGYTQIGFNIQAVPQEMLQYVPLMGSLILGMGTERNSYTEISKKIGINTGGIRSSHFSSATVQDHQSIISYIFFNGKALMEKIGDLFDLFDELFAEYSLKNHKRLLEIIRSAKADMEDSIVPNGNHFVLARLQSYNSRLGKFDELTDGITYYRFLENLLEQVEKDPQEVAGQFQKVAERVFTKQNVLFNITCEEKDYKKIEKRVNRLYDLLPESEFESVEWNFQAVPSNEGFLTASNIQHVGKGANLYELGFQYSGQFEALKGLLRTGYLWDKVRVHGGAYGSSNSFDFFSGDYGLVSYRDPNLSETLGIYDEIADFLSQLDIPSEELKKIIIGCVGKMDPPLTPDRKGSASMIDYLTGRTYEMKLKFRRELLATRLEDLKKYSELFLKIREQGKVCVLGNENKLKKEKTVFSELVQVFN